MIEHCYYLPALISAVIGCAIWHHRLLYSTSTDIIYNQKWAWSTNDPTPKLVSIGSIDLPLQHSMGMSLKALPADPNAKILPSIGLLQCLHCKGEGIIHCLHSLDTWQKECTACNGNAYYQCVKCEGTGFISKYQVDIHGLSKSITEMAIALASDIEMARDNSDIDIQYFFQDATTLSGHVVFSGVRFDKLKVTYKKRFAELIALGLNGSLGE